jgi:hypothetical protein
MSVHEVDTEQLAHILTVIDPELAANVRAAQLAAWGALKADPDESLEPDLSQVTLDPFIIREV